MNKQALYIEAYSGISGDMTLGALLDLGADREGLMKLLASLPIDEYEIRQGRTVKQGISSGYFHVDLKNDGHDHHHGDHNYPHTHDAHHNHVHRNLYDIREILARMDAAEDVKSLASRMFDIVAEAEAKAHGVPIEEVHFHEVGAVDSIIDIVGTAYCIRNLGIDEVYISSLYEGQGHVRCAHGMLPVPVPAVRNIVEAHALPLTITETRGEMVTPTGAAIAAALWNGKKLPEGVRFVRTGIGAGEKDFPHANILRISLVEVEEDRNASTEAHDKKAIEHCQQEPTLWVLETNMDDVTGEALGYTMEKLMAAGARDTYYSSIFMKKGRPAYLLRVICDETDIEKLESIIFTHTTTIGIRRYPIQRHILEREIITVDTVWGKVRVKKCVLEKGVRMYPEYEDVRRVCEETGIGFSDVYQKIKARADQLAQDTRVIEQLRQIVGDCQEVEAMECEDSEKRRQLLIKQIKRIAEGKWPSEERDNE